MFQPNSNLVQNNQNANNVNSSNSQNASSNVIDTFLRDDFQLVKPMPSDPVSYMKEIRFNMSYC